MAYHYDKVGMQEATMVITDDDAARWRDAERRRLAGTCVVRMIARILAARAAAYKARCEASPAGTRARWRAHTIETFGPEAGNGGA